MIFSNGTKSTALWTHNTTGSSLIVEASDDHKILDEDTHTWLNNRIENMPSDSTFDAEEDANLDVSELANILTDDSSQKSISRRKWHLLWVALMMLMMVMVNGSESDKHVEIFLSRIVNNICFQLVNNT